jgi:negative regulator of sigma E activity
MTKITTPHQSPHQHPKRKARPPVKARPGREPVPARYDAIQSEQSPAGQQDTFAVLPAKRGTLSSARARLAGLGETSWTARAPMMLLIACVTAAISVGILVARQHAHSKTTPESAHQRHAPVRTTVAPLARHARLAGRHPARRAHHHASTRPVTTTPDRSMVAQERASTPSRGSEPPETQGGPFSP